MLCASNELSDLQHHKASSDQIKTRVDDAISRLIRDIDLLAKHKICSPDPYSPGDFLVGYPFEIEDSENPEASIFPDMLFFEIVNTTRALFLNSQQLAANHGKVLGKIMSQTLGLPDDVILTEESWANNELDPAERMAIMSNTLDEIGALLRAIAPALQNQAPYENSPFMAIDPNAPFLSIKEAAYLSRCSPKTISNWVSDYRSKQQGNDLPWVVRKAVGEKRVYDFLIDQKAFREWLNGNSHSSMKKGPGRPPKTVS